MFCTAIFLQKGKNFVTSCMLFWRKKALSTQNVLRKKEFSPGGEIISCESFVITLLLQLFCCASTPGNDPQDLMSFRPLFYKTVFYRLHSIKHYVTLILKNQTSFE